MKMSGEKTLPLPQATVWEALNDPDILRQSIPGCESFEQIADNRYRATVASKIGPVQARFQGDVQISDIDPPNGYTLSGEGSGGAAGSAKGSAKVRLEPIPEGTRLSWEADAQVSGKLAQIGSRLIELDCEYDGGAVFQPVRAASCGPETGRTSASGQFIHSELGTDRRVGRTPAAYHPDLFPGRVSVLYPSRRPVRQRAGKIGQAHEIVAGPQFADMAFQFPRACRDRCILLVTQ